MKTIELDHLKCSEPREIGLFRKHLIQDYETKKGIVREYTYMNKKPKYRLLKTREPVKVEFI